MKAPTTWVVVADAGRCRVFQRKPGDGSLKSVIDRDLVGNVRTALQDGSDSLGRTFDRTGGQRHAKVPHTDPRDHAKDVFASEVAGFLEASSAKFDHLVLAAAPSFLGHLRAALPPVASKRITREIDKDFTKLPEDELAEAINRTLGL